VPDGIEENHGYKQDWMLFAKLKEMTNVTLKPA